MIPPVISIVANSGTGKTTLLEKLIAELKRRGYRVGAIKHDAHEFSIDHEGKDSWRLTRAGAETMLISSATRVAMVSQLHGDRAPEPLELARTYCRNLDIVLTEGGKTGTLPKIEVHRRHLGDTLLCRGAEHDPSLVAVAADSPIETDVPVFDLNDAQAICDFLVDRYLQ